MSNTPSILDKAIRHALFATAFVVAGGANAQQPSPSTSPDTDSVQSAPSTTDQAAPREQRSETGMATGDRSGIRSDAAASSAGSSTPDAATAAAAGTSDPSRPGNNTPGTITRGTAGASGANTAAAEGSADASATASARNSAGSASVQAGEPIWLLIPVELSSRSQQFANGCWVQLYSGDNFQGRAMTVVGPANLAEVRSPYGTGLNNWESAVVGPNATVTTYDDENFRARDATLRAGQRYAELDDSKLGLFEDIESMRVTCSSPSAQPGASTRSGSANTGGTSGSATTSGTSGGTDTGRSTTGSR